jgi:hypothetical protein
MIRRTGTSAALGFGLLLVVGLTAHAQQWRGGWRATPLREGAPEPRGGFTFCRLYYDSVRREPLGQGWRTDYPMSDANFMLRLSQLTTSQVSRWEDGQLAHTVVRASDDALFECPFLFASDVGTAGFSNDEVVRLRQYLLKGGFLWADDFWGERALAHWVAELRRVLPMYDVVELSLDHPIFATVYAVTRVPQIPSIQFWRRSGGETSERGAESAVAMMYAVIDETGRILVLMSHNTDIADGWEREGEDEDFFYSFSGDAYAIGINVALWTLTH